MGFWNLRFALAPAAVLVGGLLLVSDASASVINTLLTGSTGQVTVSIGSIFFNTDPAAIPGGSTCTTTFSATKPANCNSDVVATTTLAFTGGPLSTGEGVYIDNSDLTSAGFTPGSTDANNFMTFALHPSLVFSISQIGPGSGNTNCAGLAVFGTCSVFAGSPIVLELLPGSQTQVSLTVQGKASDTGVAGLPGGSSYVGSFGTTISSATPASLQAFFCPGGVCNPNTTLMSSQQGSFTASSVPEPSSIFLGSLGVAMLIVGARFRKSQGSGT